MKVFFYNNRYWFILVLLDLGLTYLNRHVLGLLTFHLVVLLIAALVMYNAYRQEVNRIKWYGGQKDLDATPVIPKVDEVVGPPKKS